MSSPVSLEAARAYLAELDLSYIVEAMCSPCYPLPQWELADALHCATLYKNFLFLQKKHRSESLVPSRQIDEFWHNHILYTQHYFQDCSHIFGHYLHHLPAKPEEDKVALVNQYVRTKQLYLEEFGHPMDFIAA